MPPIPHRAERHPWRWARWVFLAIAAVSLGYVACSFADAEIFQTYQSWKFNRSARSSLSVVQPKLLAVSGTGVPHADITRGAVLGRLDIPRIGVSVIVAEGVDARTLRRAVGHIPGTALPGEIGNVALSGHRDTFFRPLRNIRENDEVIVTTANGANRYRVDSIKVVAEDNMSVLNASTESALTLVTCYPFYYVGPAPQRFIVRAHPEGTIR